MSDYIRTKIRGYHLDQHGHLNNISYIQFLEEARWVLFETFNAIEFFSQLDLSLTLVNTSINYHRPGMLNNTLEIHTKVMRIGTASCRMEQTIYLEGTNDIIAQATNTFVLIDRTANKAVAITGKARDKLEQMANSA